jgi:hypothetical protein
MATAAADLTMFPAIDIVENIVGMYSRESYVFTYAPKVLVTDDFMADELQAVDAT